MNNTNDDKNYLRLVEVDEARKTRSNLLRFPVRLELPFKATLEIGNMKDLSFPETKSFATQVEAETWLESRAADSVCVTGGQVENKLGSVIYILADEFYGCEV